MRPTLRSLFWVLLVLALALAAAAWIVTQFYDVPLTDSSLRFERPWAALLLLGPVLAFISRGPGEAKRAPRVRWSTTHVLASMPRGRRAAFRPALLGLRVATLTLLVLALMGPQSIHARSTTDLEGIDIVLALDLSLSMQAADIEPNRFEATKQVVRDFLHRRPNDRIGAVVFGRDAYTLLPLTSDKSALQGAISSLELGVIEGRGTAIGNAVGVSLNRLRKSKAKSKVIILLTDGESNSGNVAPDQAAEFAETMGVKLYTILMGRSDDANVQQGVDLFGRPLFGRGHFPVNPELLKRMAERTGGQAFQVADRRALEQSFHAILDDLERTQIEDAGVVYGELFAAALAPSVVLLLMELVLGATFLRRWP